MFQNNDYQAVIEKYNWQDLENSRNLIIERKLIKKNYSINRKNSANNLIFIFDETSYPKNF